MEGMFMKKSALFFTYVVRKDLKSELEFEQFLLPVSLQSKKPSETKNIHSSSTLKLLPLIRF